MRTALGMLTRTPSDVLLPEYQFPIDYPKERPDTLQVITIGPFCQHTWVSLTSPGMKFPNIRLCMPVWFNYSPSQFTISLTSYFEYIPA